MKHNGLCSYKNIKLHVTHNYSVYAIVFGQAQSAKGSMSKEGQGRGDTALAPLIS